MAADQGIASALGQPVHTPSPELVLQELQNRGLLAEGKAHIISLAAVRTAFGARWSERKSLVWEMTNAQIRRRIGARDFSARLNDTDFLIITLSLEPGPARVLAARVLQDVLNHFLGVSEPAHITIRVVCGFSEGELSCRDLTVTEVASILADNPSPSTPSAHSTLVTSEDADGAALLDGRRLRFSSSVDPIIDLVKWAVAGQRIEPKIQFQDSLVSLTLAERRQLPAKAVQTIDMSTLKRALGRLTSGESVASKPSLIITVSFLTLSNTAARTALLVEASRQRALMTQAIIWEITDFEEGLPIGRLEECAVMLKPFCRSVFARRQGSAGSGKFHKALGIHGLVVQPPLEMMPQEDLMNWLVNMGRAMENQAPTLIATNLPSRSVLPVASAAGFTHATVRT